MLLAQLDQIYTSMGVISPEEVRALRFGNVLEGPSPAAEASGVGQQTQQMLGSDKLTSAWTTMTKNEDSESIHKILDATNNHIATESESVSINKKIFDDPLRNALNDAINIIITTTYLKQRHTVTDVLKSFDSPQSCVGEIKSLLQSEPVKMANGMQQAYADAIKIGAQHGLFQLKDAQKVPTEEINHLAYAEALRFATRLSEQTQSDFAHILEKFPTANATEIIHRVYTPKRIHQIVEPEVNRLFNLGIQLAGKTNNVQKMKWLAHCTVCQPRNNTIMAIDSNVIPGLHRSCTCTLELLSENE